MVVLIAVGVAYTAWMIDQGRLTSTDRLDGIIGVLLGLFTCSYPAAHFLDLLLFHRDSLLRDAERRSVIAWILANGLVLAVGLAVIILGMTRFTRRGA